MITLLVYSYICITAIVMGLYVGVKGFPPRRHDYNSPFLIFVVWMNVPLAPLVLWIQESYGFQASQSHIGGVGISFVTGFLFGSWIESRKYKDDESFITRQIRFNRVRVKISAAVIGGVWGALIGNQFTVLSFDILLRDGYISTISILGVIAGWVISGSIFKRFIELHKSNKRTQSLKLSMVNLISLVGLFHLCILIFLKQGGFIMQGIAVSLLGAPAVTIAILTGVDGAR